MVVAVGELLIIDGGVRHASAGQRMPVMAVAGGFAMLWAYELNVQLVGALTGQKASTLIALLPAVVLDPAHLCHARRWMSGASGCACRAQRRCAR